MYKQSKNAQERDERWLKPWNHKFKTDWLWSNSLQEINFSLWCFRYQIFIILFSLNNIFDGTYYPGQVTCDSCGAACALRTANTESNQGRQFYTCQSQECNFFVYVYSIPSMPIPIICGMANFILFFYCFLFPCLIISLLIQISNFMYQSNVLCCATQQMNKMNQPH